MRRTKLWLVVALAVVCGGAAGFLTLELLQDRASTETASSPPTTRVVVAARALQPGSVVGRQDVKTVEWPASSASSAFARDVREVVGRGVTAPVSEDEPLLRSKLAGEEAGGGLSVVIPEGMR
ncbi:MAG: Flp pilus assembly protein CpaB, partial [Gemmatimonadota bacterium]|nr:Flp pilus assembly protein CpaB [Gemmatimonadota bacterium]